MSPAVSVLTDEAALAALEPEWWDLWRRCASATPFQTPAWLLPWWRCYRPGTLHAIAVRCGDRLVGLAPLYREHGAAGERLLPLGIASSDYLDMLIAPEQREATAAAIATRAGTLGWDRWELEELPPDAAALGLPCPPRASASEAPHSACPVIALSGPDDLSGCVPARRRRQWRRALAAAERRGRTTIQPMDSDPEAFLAELFRLHAARWVERGEPGLLDDEAVRQFQRDSIPRLARAGLTRLYVVRIGNELVGAYEGFLAGRRAFAYLGGFDPGYSAESPGSILLGHAIRAALREGATEFHLLRGQEAYKYTWGATDRWNRRRSFVRIAA